uniref:PH domain-containing protein n=1 Tax=Setaria digitata TaxID=48799 RepID=A0A915Q6D6_9BILA
MEGRELGKVKESPEQTGQLTEGVARARAQQFHPSLSVPQQVLGSSSFPSSSIKPPTTVPSQHPRPVDDTALQAGGGAGAEVRVRQRPHIPPKPQMDAVRYSMANVQESCDWELDTLLGELSALEQQLTVGGDQALLGLPTLPSSTSGENSLNQRLVFSLMRNIPIPFTTISSMAQAVDLQCRLIVRVLIMIPLLAIPLALNPETIIATAEIQPFHVPIAVEARSILQVQLNNYGNSNFPWNKYRSKSETTFTAAEIAAFLFQRSSRSGMVVVVRHHTFCHVVISVPNRAIADVLFVLIRNCPDEFDSSNTNLTVSEELRSSVSAVRSVVSSSSNKQSDRGMDEPLMDERASPNQSSTSSTLESSQLRHHYQQQQQQQQLTRPLTANEVKAAKIREALEKMREADIKKIYVKFFIDDGSSTISLLIDERWTVAECIRRIATKLNVPLSEHHTIVEEYPELYIKRIYEDHEHLVENIMMWTLNSQNKLYFTQRLDKYSFLDRPEEFLVTQKNIDTLVHGPPSPNTKRRVIREFFEVDNVQPPETEGWLFLKSDGKKSWRKHFFVLRLSGLYYCPKGKSRNSKDLQCLMNMQTNQVYTATDWKKKYKAPSAYGFAIKHPKIQVKASKYIKYVCTEDALTFHKWMVALRIAKNGQHLYENYVEMKKRQQTESNGVVQPVKVGIPQVSCADPNRVSFVEVRKSGMRQCQQQDPAPLLNLNRDLRTSISSRLSVGTSNDENSSSHQNSIIFDQCDDVITGTIKRAPCDVLLGNRQSTLTDHRSSSDGIASPSGRSGGTAESDSDEEQFPPPPPTLVTTTATTEDSRNDVYNNQSSMVATSALKTTFSQQQQHQPSTSHARYQNGISSGHTNGNYVSDVKPVVAPVPPAKPQFVMQNRRNGNQMKDMMVSHRLHQPGIQASLAVLPKKVPPPPPPKRSDATKLQSTNAEALHTELEIAMARRLQKIGQL